MTILTLPWSFSSCFALSLEILSSFITIDSALPTSFLLGTVRQDEEIIKIIQQHLGVEDIKK